MMSPVFNINGPGAGNLFTGTYTAGTHDTFVIISLYKGIRVVLINVRTFTLKARILYAITVAVILQLAYPITLTCMTFQFMPGQEQFQYNLPGFNYIRAFSFNYHAIFCRCYTSSQQIAAPFCFNHTHTAGTSQS